MRLSSESSKTSSYSQNHRMSVTHVPYQKAALLWIGLWISTQGAFFCEKIVVLRALGESEECRGRGYDGDIP